MNWKLAHWGVEGWATLLAVTQGLECAWADYDGFHVGPCPPQPPPYTHVWAWSDDGTRMVRARVDGDQVMMAGLSADALTAWGQVPTEELEVSVETMDLLAWPEGDTTIGEQPPGLLARRIRGREVQGPQPLLFVAMDPA